MADSSSQRLVPIMTAALALGAAVACAGTTHQKGTQAPARPQPVERSPLAEPPGQDTAASNLEIVRRAYAAWAAGGTSFFDDILADDVRWTVRGSGPAARTYVGRDPFVREAAAPLTSRLDGPIEPTVRHLVAEGDIVIAVWDGKARARDGKLYENHFVWVFRMQGGKAVEVEAFLDLTPYYEVLNRVPGR